MNKIICPYCKVVNIVAGLTSPQSQAEGKSPPQIVTCFKCGKKFQPKHEVKTDDPE